MADGPGGMRVALAEALAGGDGDQSEPEPLLFDGLDASETGALDAPSPLSAAFTPRPRGGGRRPGSRNRRTEATVSWLLSQHRHPLLVMMEAYSMTPQALALQLGLGEDADLLEVYKLQLRMAEAVAPYVAQRLPQAVQIDARAGVTLSFEGVSLPARAGSAGAGEGDLVEGLALRLPFKSDDASRTDG